MEDKIFFKYFKKNSRSSSPPIKKTLNELLDFPFKLSKTPNTKNTSPRILPEISNTNNLVPKIQTTPHITQTRATQKYFTVKIDSKTKEEDINSPKVKMNKTLKTIIEKDDSEIMRKYKGIREEYIDNQIKFVSFSNELKEEVNLNNFSMKALYLSLNILDVVNQKFYFQVENPLSLSISTIKSFLFLEENELSKNIEEIMKINVSELKKMPLLSITRKVCSEISKQDEIFQSVLNEKQLQNESLMKKLEEIRLEKELLMNNIENNIKETLRIKEKELDELKNKVNEFDIKNRHL